MSELAVLAGSDEGLFIMRSNDEGKSWKSPERAPLPEVEVAAIRRAPDGAVYVGTRGNGLFRSRDGLRHWEQVDTPPALHKLRSLAIDAERFLAGNEAGPGPVAIFEWEAGQQWRQLGDLAQCSGASAWFYPVETEGVHIRHLARDPHKPERLYAAVQVGGVAVSADGGESWTDRRNLDCDVHMVEADPNRPGVLYAGSGGGGLYKSADYGDTWECISEGCGQFVVQFAMDPRDTQRLYLGTARGGVRAWRTDPAGARGEMWRSEDGGASWHKLRGGLPEFMRSRVNAVYVDPEEPDHVFFSGGHTKGEPDSGVHFSPDGGETWRSIAPIDEVIVLSSVRL